jgi:hypothetical protein
MNYPDSASLEASVLRAIESNGGVASSNDIDVFVFKDLNLTQEQISHIRIGTRTEIKYRLAWVRTKAKNRGLIEKTENRDWRLRKVGNTSSEVQ